MRSHHKMPSSYSFYFLEPFSFILEGSARGHPVQLPIGRLNINCSQGTLFWPVRFGSLSGQPHPVTDCVHTESFFPYMKSEPLLFVFLQKGGICKQIKMELIRSWHKEDAHMCLQWACKYFQQNPVN